MHVKVMYRTSVEHKQKDESRTHTSLGTIYIIYIYILALYNFDLNSLR